MSTTARFTVGKLDAGMAILLTEDNHLIEFPSILLPQGVSSGCIVNISVMRDPSQERSMHFAFRKLQDSLLEEFGTALPDPPNLVVHAITQTSVTLLWSPLQLKRADLRALEIYRESERVKTFNAHNLPKDCWTKVGGLEIDREYEFHLRLRTSAGVYESKRVKIRTHSMDNMSSIRVAFGEFERGEREEAIEKLKECLKRINAAWTEEGVVGRDTTHLLARVPRGTDYEEALRWNIPVVRPEWLFACEQKKRLQPPGSFYLKGPSSPAVPVVRSIAEL